MAKKIGKDCKVAIGATRVGGMGTWSLSGVSADQLDTSEFGDDWKQFEFGMKDGGSVSFAGFLDPADAKQNEVMLANLENSDLTTLRLYVDDTSYFEPCQTTGYFNPSITTTASTQLSRINITSFNLSADKSGMLQVDFSAKVSGVMVLV